MRWRSAASPPRSSSRPPRRGELEEAWGTGTAAVVSPIGELAEGDKKVTVSNNQIGPVTPAPVRRAHRHPVGPPARSPRLDHEAVLNCGLSHEIKVKNWTPISGLVFRLSEKSKDFSDSLKKCQYFPAAAPAEKSSLRSLNALSYKAFRAFDPTRGGLPPPRAPPP